MAKKTTLAQKLTAKATVDKLDEILTKGNIEQLKKQMEKLFTFKNIFNMHDDHLTELAESIVDLGMSEDKKKWARQTEDYLHIRIARYQERKKNIAKKYTWAKTTKNTDEVAMLDLQYRLWVYESGFEYSHFQMYTMLLHITQEILQHEEEGRK